MVNYFDNPALNCSKLKLLSKHPRLLVTEKPDEDEDSDAIIIGSLSDAYLTEPAQIDNYLVVDIPEVPSDNIQKLCKDYSSSGDFEVAYSRNPLSIKNSLDRIKDRFEKEGKVYFDFLQKSAKLISEGKKLITLEQESLAKRVSTSLLTHTFTKHHFEQLPHIEIWYQKELYWDMMGVHCKAKFDLIRIDHENKVIYPNDIKVMSQSSLNFMTSFKRFEYYLQAAFYLRGFYETYGLVYKDYDIQPFNFIVGSSKYPDTPMNWQISLDDLNLGHYGGVINGVKIKGYEQLIEDYLWHTGNGLYDYPREVYQNHGILATNLV